MGLVEGQDINGRIVVRSCMLCLWKLDYDLSLWPRPSMRNIAQSDENDVPVMGLGIPMTIPVSNTLLLAARLFTPVSQPPLCLNPCVHALTACANTQQQYWVVTPSGNTNRHCIHREIGKAGEAIVLELAPYWVCQVHTGLAARSAKPGERPCSRYTELGSADLTSRAR